MNELSNFNASESFPFFNLPDLVISKILKEFVPVTDKAETLSQMKEFKPYISRKSMWFQSTLNLFHLTKSIKLGWYVDPDNIHNRYYLSVDYFNLNFTIHSFCSRFSGVPIIQHTEKLYRPPSSVEAVVKKFSSFGLFPVEENEVLMYHWLTQHPYRDIFFWINRSFNVIRASFSNKLYPLQQDMCRIYNGLMHRHEVLLVIKEDLSLEICCEKCGDLSCIHEKCECPLKNNYNYNLLPLIFHACDKINPTDFYKCKCRTDSSRTIYAVSKLTFTEFEKENVLVYNNHFIKTLALISYNIISTWNKTDEINNPDRNMRWINLFLRMPYKLKLPL